MSDLLTATEYRAIAESLDFPKAAFIDGKFRAGRGAKLKTINPATGKKLCEIAACNAADVDLAVKKAREAFDQGHWARLHPSERKDVLIRLCKLITRNRRELAVMESLDSGKPIRDCETIDIPETIHTIKWHAEAVDKLYDQTAPAGDDAMAMIVREPIGVVASGTAVELPVAHAGMENRTGAGAGNSVIVKPAEQTSLTALRVAELGHGSRRAARCPAGSARRWTVSGRTARVCTRMWTWSRFTGSTETGKRFLRYSADSNLKKVVLECGGKNPAVVLEDAENLDLVAEHVVNAAFWNMGENCSANSRLIVHKAVKEPLMKSILARLRDWKTGDPLDPANHLGALVDKEHCKKVAAFLKSPKGKVLSGGKMDGAFVEPTIIDGVKPADKLAKDEIFGPVLSVITVLSFDEAIEVANDTDYGLTASVFTANGRKALRAARAIRAGTVTINCYGEGDISTPFGGYKQSGFGGRDNGVHAHDQYTELKTIWIDLSDPASGDNVS